MIRTEWTATCDTCDRSSFTTVEGRSRLITRLRNLGWGVRCRAGSTKVEKITCPVCIDKQLKEEHRVVEEIKQMKQEFHPLTSGVMSELKQRGDES